MILKAISALLPWRAWAALGVAASLVAAGLYINARAYNRGFDAADAQWVALVETEIGRQRSVNQETQEWARDEVARLQSVKEERDALIDKLDEIAAASPSAGNVCLDPDSVRRLDLGD